MIAAYLDAMRNYVRFDGRTSRAGLWWFKASMGFLCLAALGVDSLFFGGSEGGEAPLFGLALLAHLVPSVAVDVRRLHDTNRSGWFALLGLVPLVGPVVLLLWFCQAGTTGPNRFGPDPLNGVAAPSTGATTSGFPAHGGSPIAAAVRDVVAEVERLARLRADGSLSEAEFQAFKRRVVATAEPA